MTALKENSLKKDISNFSFVEREKRNDKYIKNRCSRDFIYYSLNYYYSERFNEYKNNPVQLEKGGELGFNLPWFLMWTGLQLYKLPGFLEENNLKLEINNKKITSYFGLIKSFIFSSFLFHNAVTLLKDEINKGNAVGIDISLGMFGLLDHVMFVYGYDEENLYVFDTHKVPGLEYKKVDEENFIMQLPIKVVKKRWTRFGRVWVIGKIN